MSENLLEKLAREGRENREYLKEVLESGHKTFNHPVLKQEGFIHPSSKAEGVIQFTYFDEFGPVGDFEADTVEELAWKIYQYGFVPCEEKDIKYSILAEKKEKKVFKNRENELEL